MPPTVVNVTFVTPKIASINKLINPMIIPTIEANKTAHATRELTP